MACPLRVFAGSASPQLTARICKHLGMQPSCAQSFTFSEGNTFVRLGENVRGCEAFYVQTLSRPVNDRFMELLFAIDALKRASATGVTAVIPFFSYAKGDKKDEPRVSIRARVCADCLEAVGVDRILTMDLHAPQIQGFFRVPVDHLYALPILVDYLHKEGVGGDEWVVVAPDVGFGEQARRYARALGAQTCIAEKQRAGYDEKATVDRIIGDVRGKKVVILDDFTTSGGTLIATAQRLRVEGATTIWAGVSHAVLGKGAAKAIDASPIERLLITDTVEGHPEALPSRTVVVSAAGLFAEAIRSIHDRTSVSRLFELPPRQS
jgi:ribose-phosphate pyrophosphokinase